MSSRGGLLALTAAAACWGMTVVTITVAGRTLTVLGVTAVELGGCLVVLAAALGVRRRRLARPPGRLVLAALMEPGLSYLLLNAGITRTSGSHAALLVGTESAFVVALGAIVGRDRPPALTVAGLGCAMGGVALLATSGGGRATLTGDALVLTGAVTAAAYVLLAAGPAARLDALTVTVYQFAIGSLAILPVLAVALARGGPAAAFGRAEPSSLLAAALTGVLGSAVAFALFGWALGRLSTNLAGISLSLIPVFGVLFSVTLLAEPLTGRTCLAGAAVVAGMTLAHRAERPTPRAFVTAAGSARRGGAGQAPPDVVTTTP